MMKLPRNVIELAQALVRIPSVNPAGTPGTDGIFEENIVRYLADFLTSCGAKVKLQPVFKHRPNLLATFPTHQKAKARVLFAPHTDTVSVAGMTIDPFSGKIIGGKLLGRGATDTKGPMAAMLWALKEWAASPKSRTCEVEVQFAALMGEEAGNEGAIALAKTGYRADLVVVGEPTEMKVVHAHKGAVWITIKTQGKACHGSTPERGENAIYKMRKILDRLENKVIPALANKKHPSLGAISLNVGTIQGGSKANIVPDSCQIEIDIRTIPSWPHDKILSYIKREVASACRDATVESKQNPPPLETNPQNSWVKQLVKVSKGTEVAPWFCDAAVFAAHGSPSVAFGPGSIRQAHVKDEFIKVSDLQAGTKAYRKFLDSLSTFKP